MNICFIGKYPPIEGGVSAQSYWLVRGLASRGHCVQVVTNADEVEDEFRMLLSAGDWPWYQPVFPDTGGSVTVWNPEPFSHQAMAHIPESNPFVTKLASLATDVIRRSRCEVILAYYYEPYAIAGWMASQWTGLPLLVRHAGSDLDRLCAVPDLSTAYKEMLRRADAVITQRRLMPRFLGMGVARGRLEMDLSYSLPGDVFHPSAPALEVQSLAMRDGPAPAAAFDAVVPTIGTYGKIGQAKGTFDLITALGRLAAEGALFQLLAMVGEAQGQQLRPSLERAGIADRTWILPLLPNWRVPGFIRACTAVCFLERDFPIAIHGPIVPREVLACGCCLIVSAEIASKQRYAQRLATGENVQVVRDPKDHAELASMLRLAVNNPQQAMLIGQKGRELSRDIENHEAFLDGWETLIIRRGRRQSRAEPERNEAPASLLDETIPGLVRYLRARQPCLLEEFLKTGPRGDGIVVGSALCEFASANVDSARFAGETPQLLDALRYLRARLNAAHDPAPEDDVAVFAVTDRLRGQAVSPESAGHLYPVRGNRVRAEEFEYEVSGVFLPLPFDFGDEPDSLTHLNRSPMTVLFQRSPNLIVRELRVDDSVRQLLKFCDGAITARALVERMCDDAGIDTAEERADISTRVFDALDRLYRARVIVFGERRLGWGWSGGGR